LHITYDLKASAKSSEDALHALLHFLSRPRYCQ
jgi:hypothetical protein